MKPPRAVGLALLLSFAWGCYGMRPVDPAAPPPPGTPVRVRLTGGERFVPPGREASDSDQRYRGDLVAWTDQALTLRIVSPTNPLEPETLEIPRRFVSTVETIHLDRGKTALALLGGGAVLGLVVASQFNSAGGSPPSPNPPPDEGGLRIPVVRIPLGR